jgi:hypothetical protein
VSTFKSAVLVNIREFYEDRQTGEEKPGNKGIALSVDQWRRLYEQVSKKEETVLTFHVLYSLYTLMIKTIPFFV